MDWTKALDTIIKAPLWFFFAAAAMCIVPLLNLAWLARIGVTSDLKPLGYALGYYAVAFTCLFVSSATARSWPMLGHYSQNALDQLKWKRRLSALPEDARALLAQMEELALDWVWYDPRSREVSLLRDRDILEAELVAGEWGRYSLTSQYKIAYSRHRSLFRSMLKCSQTSAVRVQATMHTAERVAR